MLIGAGSSQDRESDDMMVMCLQVVVSRSGHSGDSALESWESNTASPASQQGNKYQQVKLRLCSSKLRLSVMSGHLLLER